MCSKKHEKTRKAKFKWFYASVVHTVFECRNKCKKKKKEKGTNYFSFFPSPLSSVPCCSPSVQSLIKFLYVFSINLVKKKKVFKLSLLIVVDEKLRNKKKKKKVERTVIVVEWCSKHGNVLNEAFIHCMQMIICTAANTSSTVVCLLITAFKYYL